MSFLREPRPVIEIAEPAAIIAIAYERTCPVVGWNTTARRSLDQVIDWIQVDLVDAEEVRRPEVRFAPARPLALDRAERTRRGRDPGTVALQGAEQDLDGAGLVADLERFEGDDDCDPEAGVAHAVASVSSTKRIRHEPTGTSNAAASASRCFGCGTIRPRSSWETIDGKGPPASCTSWRVRPRSARRSARGVAGGRLEGLPRFCENILSGADAGLGILAPLCALRGCEGVSVPEKLLQVRVAQLLRRPKARPRLRRAARPRKAAA